MALYFAHYADDEIARADERVEDVHAFVRKDLPNSFLRMSSTERTIKSTMGCGV